MCLVSSLKNPHESPLRKLGDFDLKIVTQNCLISVFIEKDTNHKLSHFTENTLNKPIFIIFSPKFRSIKPNTIGTAAESLITELHEIE